VVIRAGRLEVAVGGHFDDAVLATVK